MKRDQKTQHFEQPQAALLPPPNHEFTLFVMSKLNDRLLGTADIAQLRFLARNPVNLRDWQVARPDPQPCGDEGRAAPVPAKRKTAPPAGLRGNSAAWFLQPDDIPSEMVEHIIATSPPARFIDRDEHATLVRAAMASLSLDLTDKQRVFDAVDSLSGWQYDQLIALYSEESERFCELSAEHPEDILLISARRTLGLFAMLTLRGLYANLATERHQLVEMIDRQCMRAPRLHTVVSSRALWPPVIDEVYGHLLVEPG